MCGLSWTCPLFVPCPKTTLSTLLHVPKLSTHAIAGVFNEKHDAVVCVFWGPLLALGGNSAHQLSLCKCCVC